MSDIAAYTNDHLQDWLAVLQAYMCVTANEAAINGLTVADCVAYAEPRIAAIEAELARRFRAGSTSEGRTSDLPA